MTGGDPLDIPDQPPDAGESSDPAAPYNRRLLSGILAVAALALFAGAVWYAYVEGIRAGGEKVAPLIKAEAGPAKIKPANPGGIDPPHQDKLVYNEVAPGQSGIVPERVRPAPETPVAPAGQTADGRSADRPETGRTTGSTRAMEPPPGSPLGAAAGSPPEAVSSAAVASRAETAPEPGSARPNEERPAAARSIGAYRIQIASLRASDAARGAWDRVQAANKDILGNLDFFVEKVNLGEKRGVYYRVQGGPIRDRATAASICDQLHKRSVSCIVVHG